MAGVPCNAESERITSILLRTAMWGICKLQMVARAIMAMDVKSVRL